MKFSLGTNGADSVNQGVRGIFSALAQAPLVRQQAEQQAALRDAQTYNANMSGNKSGAQAEQERFTLDQRRAVPDVAPAGMPGYEHTMRKIFQMTGDTNADRVSKALINTQTAGIRDKAAENVGNVDLMNRYNTLAKEGATYMPFDDVGTSGYALNKATGSAVEANSVLAKLFGAKTNSEIGENNAQANNANASAGQHNASKEKITTETSRLKAGGSAKGLTAAQMRENTAIQEAREQVSGMTQAQVDALLAKNSFDITPGDRNLINTIQRAQKPMFGESDITPVQHKPEPPAPPPEPGALRKVMNWLAVGNANPSKVDAVANPMTESAAPAPAAPKMDNNIQQAADAVRAAYKAGKITRDEAKKQLQGMGFN